METYNAITAKRSRKHRYQAHVGIHFGTDGTSFAYVSSWGKVFFQQLHTFNADLKDKTNILLENKEPYNVIEFGEAATRTLQYRKSNDKTLLYFADFTLKFNHALVNNYKCDDNDEKKQQKPIIYLTASNGKQLDSKIG
eukprot:55037_1